MNSSFDLTREQLSPGLFLIVLSGPASEELFLEKLNQMRDWMLHLEKSGQRCALLIDPSQMTRFDASLRKVYGQWRAENLELIGRTLTRAAYIAESAVWRGVLTAVFWFARPIIPVKLVANREEGTTWILSNSPGGDY